FTDLSPAIGGGAMLSSPLWSGFLPSCAPSPVVKTSTARKANVMLRSIVFLPMEGEFQVSEPKSTQSVWGRLIIRNARQTVQRNSIAQTGKIASRRRNRHLRAAVRHAVRHADAGFRTEWQPVLLRSKPRLGPSAPGSGSGARCFSRERSQD